jgi:hypothetical protein
MLRQWSVREANGAEGRSARGTLEVTSCMQTDAFCE